VLSLTADYNVDATFDHQPVLIAPDVMAKPVVDDDRLGNNRRLSPIGGFPAIPAAFRTDGLQAGGSPPKTSGVDSSPS
jgi:hypothetical protein